MARLKVTQLCPCLSYFPGFFDNFESMAFLENGGGGECFSQFFKGTTIKEPCFKKGSYFDYKMRANLTAGMYQRLVQQKSMFLWKNCGYLDSVFSGDKDEYIQICGQLKFK